MKGVTWSAFTKAPLEDSEDVLISTFNKIEEVCDTVPVGKLEITRFFPVSKTRVESFTRLISATLCEPNITVDVETLPDGDSERVPTAISCTRHSNLLISVAAKCGASQHFKELFSFSLIGAAALAPIDISSTLSGCISLIQECEHIHLALKVLSRQGNAEAISVLQHLIQGAGVDLPNLGKALVEWPANCHGDINKLMEAWQFPKKFDFN